MELKHLRCFAAAAEALHFGQAAQQLNMLPSALGRCIRQLEDELGTSLFARSTRAVSLTPAGTLLVGEAQAILDQVAQARARVRALQPGAGSVLRIGAIDSAAAGLLPEMLYAFRLLHPDITTTLTEDKSVRILPMLEQGRLDLGFVRPPVRGDGIAFEHLFDERPVVVLPETHALAGLGQVPLAALADLPLIVPPRQTRPHSHRVVMQLFRALGLSPNVVQEVEEKQTTINLVAAGIGIGIVPEWMSRMRVPGVQFRPILLAPGQEMPDWALGLAWNQAAGHRPRDLFMAVARRWKRR